MVIHSGIPSSYGSHHTRFVSQTCIPCRAISALYIDGLQRYVYSQLGEYAYSITRHSALTPIMENQNSTLFPTYTGLQHACGTSLRGMKIPHVNDEDSEKAIEESRCRSSAFAFAANLL